MGHWLSKNGNAVARHLFAYCYLPGIWPEAQAAASKEGIPGSCLGQRTGRGGPAAGPSLPPGCWAFITACTFYSLLASSPGVKPIRANFQNPSGQPLCFPIKWIKMSLWTLLPFPLNFPHTSFTKMMSFFFKLKLILTQDKRSNRDKG